MADGPNAAIVERLRRRGGRPRRHDFAFCLTVYLAVEERKPKQSSRGAMMNVGKLHGIQSRGAVEHVYRRGKMLAGFNDAMRETVQSNLRLLSHYLRAG